MRSSDTFEGSLRVEPAPRGPCHPLCPTGGVFVRGTDASVAFTRRTVLGGVALVLPTVGCLQGPGDRPAASTDEPRGTGDPPTRLWFEQATLDDSERAAAAPIVFADLPRAEREIVETALTEGEYTVRSEDTSPALDSLCDRSGAHADGGLVVYLERNGTHYRVGFAAGDYIVAHPTQ